jgi:hypothetical protein
MGVALLDSYLKRRCTKSVTISSSSDRGILTERLMLIATFIISHFSPDARSASHPKLCLISITDTGSKIRNATPTLIIQVIK